MRSCRGFGASAMALAIATLLAFADLAAAQGSRQITVEPASPNVQPPADALAPAEGQPPTDVQSHPQPISPGQLGPQPLQQADVPAQDCGVHKFVEPEDMVALIATDLDKVSPKARARGLRYLTLTHLTNICVNPVALEVYRQGVVKLANSLGRSSDVVRFEPIDPDRSILRISLDDLGWDAAEWENLLAIYPYAVRPDTQLFGVLENVTGTKLPYVRADWFAFTASRPPLYNTLLKLPKTIQAFAKDQGVDIDGDIKRFQVMRAGFQKSGVSTNNRVIERHSSRSGYFWTSYDFAGNKAKQSIFEFPLGPGGANGFDPDGGETIFSLPNGFQGYLLSNAKGEVLDKGLTTIVRDLSQKDGAVTNGISCMGCHDLGMRKAKDELRASVLSSRTFSRDVRDAVEVLHPPTERIDQMIDGDASRFTQAMLRAGLDPTLHLNGVEMINALSDWYDGFVNTVVAAAELGLTPDDMVSAARDNGRKFRALMTRLDQGMVSREEFEGRFAELIDAFTDEKIIKIGKPAKSSPATPSLPIPKPGPAPAYSPSYAPGYR